MTSRRHPRRRNPPRAAAPPAPSPYLLSLREDHARFSRVLTLIGRHAPQLRDDPQPVLPLFEEAIDYVVNFQNVQHHPREDRMFARIAARLRSIAPLAARLAHEHGATEQAGRRLLRLLQASAVARAGRRERDLLAAGLEEFATRMRDHMRLEEELMYSRALERLTAADWETMSAEAGLRDPLALADVKRYRRLARYVRTGEAQTRVSLDIPPLEELARLVRSPRLRTVLGLGALGVRQLREAGELWWRASRAMPWVPILRPGPSLRAMGDSAQSFAEWARACRREWQQLGRD
jgi:hemerythrin-like domain-containing protein